MTFSGRATALGTNAGLAHYPVLASAPPGSADLSPGPAPVSEPGRVIPRCSPIAVSRSSIVSSRLRTVLGNWARRGRGGAGPPPFSRLSSISRVTRARSWPRSARPPNAAATQYLAMSSSSRRRCRCFGGSLPQRKLRALWGAVQNRVVPDAAADPGRSLQSPPAGVRELSADVERRCLAAPWFPAGVRRAGAGADEQRVDLAGRVVHGAGATARRRRAVRPPEAALGGLLPGRLASAGAASTVPTAVVRLSPSGGT